MRTLLSLLSLLPLLSLSLNAQKIEYSRRNFKTPDPVAMQLVSNIAGYHHVLCFTANEKVSIYVYDGQLQLQSRKEIQFKLRENTDIKMIPFIGFYFLYIHQPGSSQHELWKIDPQGDAVSLSDLFKRLIETAFKKNIATLQLTNKENQLFIIVHTYYDELEKIGSTVVQADKNLNIVTTRKVFYSFKRFEEMLKQVMLVGNDLLILKTSSDSAGYSLQLIKAKLNTGNILMNSFNSSHLYINPGFSYNAADSSITLYSMIDKTVFMTKLDYLLNEIVPVTLLKTQFKSKTSSNFLLVEGESQKWLSMQIAMPGGRSARTNPSSVNDQRSVSDPKSVGDPGLSRTYYSSDFAETGVNYLTPMLRRRSSISYSEEVYPIGPAVRFTLLNSRFKVVTDTLVANDKNSYTLQARQFANAVMNDKSYLFLSQRFGTNRQGVLMISGNNNSQLLTTDIRVYDKYEYLLPQLQEVNGKYIILPYTYKREVGLLKVTME